MRIYDSNREFKSSLQTLITVQVCEYCARDVNEDIDYYGRTSEGYNRTRLVDSPEECYYCLNEDTPDGAITLPEGMKKENSDV